MNKKRSTGFSLVEVIAAVGIFLLFAVGIYSALSFVFKIVYRARLEVLETQLAVEQLEVARNLPFDSVGILNGVPAGLLLHGQTLVRDNIIFSVTTTVRNIDDPFDGTIGGTPNDSAPADYKLVEVVARCLSCVVDQQGVTLSTRISPKNLEGASQNGALFVQVFDADGLPVVGANVHIVHTGITPNLVIDDLTGNDGYVRVIDAPTGTMSYQIAVSKNGYSSDFTVLPSLSNPNPVKPPANVVSQLVTNISFAIDRTGNFALHTLSPACVAIAGAPFTLNGSKTIGTTPTVYKYSATTASDGAGNKSFLGMEWDPSYTVSVSGTAYDLAGSIPLLPWSLLPAMDQDVTLLLSPHTNNSLLVQVKDAGTGLPLSDATVTIDSGVPQTLVTGLGYTRQTDWSGGSGQTSFVDTTRYFNDDGNVVAGSPAGDLKLRKIGPNYLGNGLLESSTFDMGMAVNFNNLVIDPISQPAQTGSQSILIQVAASNSSTPASWSYSGPDGTASSFYTATSTLLHSSLSGKRYVRYMVYLSTQNNNYTPQLSELSFTYTTSCAAPGQTFFNSLSSGLYTLTVDRSGYTTNSGQIDVSGNGTVVVNMSPAI